MHVIARTPRLLLREFSPDDAGGFFLLNADPEVLRHTGDKPFADVAAARAFLMGYDHYRRHGYGRWSVVLKETGEYAGFCGLRHDASLGETDLGFRLPRSLWNRGLATEAACAALRVGFEDYGLERIVGRARAANTASLRVLEKLGMVPAGAFEEDGAEWRRYELRRPAPPR